MKSCNNTYAVRLKEFCIIQNAPRGLLYHIPTMSLLESDPKAWHLLSRVRRGVSLQKAACAVGINEEAGESLIRHLIQEVDRRPRVTRRQPSELGNSLTLIVALHCNLGCTYCYAGGGDYGLCQPLPGSPNVTIRIAGDNIPTRQAPENQLQMSPDMAIRIIDVLPKKVGSLGKIMFFGGEPTLNLDAIEAVCDHLSGQYREGRIADLPTYSMVTNATRVTDRFIRMVNQYRIRVTVSIDGPQEVTNAQRLTKGGRGAYPQIRRGIERLLRESTLPIQYEATYTKEHVKRGLTIRDVLEYMRQEFGLTVGTLSLYAGPTDNPLSLSPEERFSGNPHKMEELVEYLFCSLIEDDNPLGMEVVVNLLARLIQRTSPNYVCPVGLNIFAVTPSGDVYPCQMFVGHENFNMGNVLDPAFGHDTEQFRRVHAMFAGLNKAENPKCRRCWVQDFCQGCVGAQFLCGGDTWEMDADHCQTRRAMGRRFLQLVNQTRKVPEKWRRFIDAVQMLTGNDSQRGEEACP